jgi:hypothetical protein
VHILSTHRRTLLDGSTLAHTHHLGFKLPFHPSHSLFSLDPTLQTQLEPDAMLSEKIRSRVGPILQRLPMLTHFSMIPFALIGPTYLPFTFGTILIFIHCMLMTVNIRYALSFIPSHPSFAKGSILPITTATATSINDGLLSPADMQNDMGRFPSVERCQSPLGNRLASRIRFCPTYTPFTYRRFDV